MEIEPMSAILRKSKMFSGLSGEEIELLLSRFGADIRSYSKGETMLRSGIMLKKFGMLVSGRAEIVHEDFWGNRTLISELLPGQLFAEAFAFSECVKTYVTVVAEKDCTALWLDADRVTDVEMTSCAHITVLKNMLSDFVEKTLTVNEKIRHMSKRTTRQKLMSYLSSVAEKREADEFDIPLDRSRLADYLAVDRSAMTTELSRLKRDGVIDFSGRRFRLLRKNTF